MRKVFEHPDLYWVSFCKGVLETHGLDSIVKNQNASSLAGAIPFTSCYPELWILDDNRYDEAMAILGSLKEERDGGVKKPRTCQHCGETIEKEFDSCWRCSKGAEDGEGNGDGGLKESGGKTENGEYRKRGDKEENEVGGAVFFRLTVMISMTLYATFVVIPWIQVRWMSKEALDAITWNGFEAIGLMPSGLYWFFSLVTLLAQAGLLFFSREARFFYSGTVVFWALLVLLSGIVVFTSLDALLSHVILLLNGGILAMAFTSPLRERFERRDG